MLTQRNVMTFIGRLAAAPGHELASTIDVCSTVSKDLDQTDDVRKAAKSLGTATRAVQRARI